MEFSPNRSPLLMGQGRGVPLLFALSLEYFLCKICLNPDITGLDVGGVQLKVLAYADDMLFSLTNPSISLPNLLFEFNLYETLSHLKININKSEATHSPELSFKFKWMDSALKCLGTYIPSELFPTSE